MEQIWIGKLFSIGFTMLYGLALIPGSSSGNSPVTGKLSGRQSLDHEGKLRSFRFYIPDPPPQEPCSVVLLLHGHGGSADQLMGLNGRQAPYRLWMPLADRERLILIVPEGLVSSDGKSGWNDARGIDTNPDSNDVDFLIQLVETMAHSYPVDLTRVYATGTSNGGHMALRLAAEASDRFAAVAAIAAANPDPIYAIEPKTPISVLLINGTNDRFLPYEGGNMIRDRGKVQSTDESIRYWITQNGCGKAPGLFQYPDSLRSDGCKASRSIYRNATTNIEVSLIRIDGGGACRAKY